jgi:hypothetical protein
MDGWYNGILAFVEIKLFLSCKAEAIIKTLGKITSL